MNLQQKYQNTIKKELQSELKLANPMAIPKLIKVVINTGLGEALTDRKVLEKVSADLKAITGQKPISTKAKVSISSFKLIGYCLEFIIWDLIYLLP